MVRRSDSCVIRQKTFSPGDLHEGYGHGGGVDGQVSVQIDDDADVEHVDSD